MNELVGLSYVLSSLIGYRPSTSSASITPGNSEYCKDSANIDVLKVLSLKVNRLCRRNINTANVQAARIAPLL